MTKILGGFKHYILNLNFNITNNMHKDDWGSKISFTGN